MSPVLVVREVRVGEREAINGEDVRGESLRVTRGKLVNPWLRQRETDIFGYGRLERCVNNTPTLNTA